LKAHDQTIKDDPGRVSQVLKWLLLVIELGLLCVLCLVVFLVPAPPYPGKAPEEVGLALLASLTALLCGALFVRNSKEAKRSFVSVLLTPPCVICLCVLGVVIVPITLGFFRSR
jgi:hypothetical protein